MKHLPIKLLLIEDEDSCAELVKVVLADSSPLQFILERSRNLHEGLEKLSGARFDLALLDLTLPDEIGIESYTRIHAAAPALPIVVLSGLDDQKTALRAVREGAQDYLVKGQVDSKMLVRVIQYAIERKAAAEALRESETFFRLISESVTDLIAVLDLQGRRVHTSPSYEALFDDAGDLRDTDSFDEIHPDDRDRVRLAFQETVETGTGHRIDYRLQLQDGSIRYIESQASAIKDQAGRTAKVVMISRDITEHTENIAALHKMFQELQQSHEDLKNTQTQLVQSEKLEAVSTFAAGVAHEVKNPLQTIILGVDYLSNHLTQDQTVAMVLGDMATAVHRADAIIRGLLEFSANKKRNVQDEDLNQIIDQSLLSVQNELQNSPIELVKDVAPELPPLRLDSRTMKHVFINIFMYSIRAMSGGGTLRVKTYCREIKENWMEHGRVSNFLRIGDTAVVAEVEDTAPPSPEKIHDSRSNEPALGFTVLKKIVELYGGLVDLTNEKGHRYTLTFRANKGQ
jgi:PAS domain S-box-containing protein